MAELRLVKLLLPLQLLHDTVCVCMCAWGKYGPCVRMLWLLCPCWCTGWFCFWSMVPGIGGRGGIEVSWKGGKRGDGGGSEPPTGADEDEWANKTWRNCFCKEGGWMLYRDIVSRVAKGAGWFIVPAGDSHRFTFPPSLLIHRDPSVFNYSPQPPPFSPPCPY